MASLCYLALLFLPLWISHCLEAYQILIGSKLLARSNQTWVSQNRTFAFGFAPAIADDKFLLAIWYANLPGDQTIVWSPNRDSPVGRDATVRLDSSGELTLVDGNATVWTTNSSQHNVKFGIMLDSGNFVLCTKGGSGNEDSIVWESFSHPSDTLLPNQPLLEYLELTSSKSYLGYYSLKMLQQRTSLSLALAYISTQVNSSSLAKHANISYWSSPDISNATGNVIAILDESGSFVISYGTSYAGTMYVHQNDSGLDPSVIRRITIARDGNLRLYRWDDNGEIGKWTVEWSAISNPCTVAGVCGSGICNLDSSKTNANCKCLSETHPMSFGSMECSSVSQVFTVRECINDSRNQPRMEILSQTNYFFSGASTISNYSGLSMGSKCSEYCLADCNCVASIYGLVEEKTYCWTLKSMVFGGWQDPSSTLYLKIWSNSSGTGVQGSREQSSNQSSHNNLTILPLILCISVLIILMSLLLCHSITRWRAYRQQGVTRSSLSLSGAPLHFRYQDLIAATSSFSQLIGTGGFGSVYKGTLRDGTLVAVKKLDKVLPQGEKEFITEVTTIGSMHHMNLVSLYGFCSEQSHRLLVYEYMSNGSLDKWIFPPGQEKKLDWETRFSIAISVAQGIAYFHEQCRNRIIHCDIKPENILLDETFCPKLSDFGLAKLMNRQQSRVVTMVRGTRGYLAPEWLSNMPITVKADVFSYGMLLLEIVGGRRNLDMSLDEERFFYPGWAFKEMINGTPGRAADEKMEGEVEEEELLRALRVAFWCIQEEVLARPSMGEVVKMLEGSAEMNDPPMPQVVQELVKESLPSVYKAIKGHYLIPSTSSSATYSYSSLLPR